MKTVVVSLDSINDVKSFVNAVNKYEFEVDLVSGRYIVDAKSIMGIFSLDLLKPITVNIQSDDAQGFIDEIKEYIR